MPIILRAGELESTWYPEHGMVGASLTHRGGELLGQRGGLDAYLTSGSAFGIPLLAPWANRLDGLRYDEVELDPGAVKGGDTGLPKDGGGVLVGREWTVVGRHDNAITAELVADAPILAVFPFPHRWRVTVTLTPLTLLVETSLAATGDVPVPIAFGWHPLFTLPGVRRDGIDVKLPVRVEGLIDPRGIPTGETQSVVIAPGALDARDLDAEYLAWENHVVLRGGGRRLQVHFDAASGYPVGHLWSPQAHDFVAWEPMTAPTNALVTGDGLRHVTPGDTFTATFSVTVDDD